MYEDIYERNKGLLTMLARRYARVCALDRAVSVEDLIQAGFLALVRAAQSYDPGAGKSWAGWHIRREFESVLGLREGRFTRSHTGADTLDRPASSGDGEGESAMALLADDSLPDVDEALLLEELRRGVREAVERLDSGERRAVQLCKLEGLSYREAAADMGVSVGQARRLCARAGDSLARDRRLRALAGLDERTRFHAHKGVRAFNRDWTSVTEGAALWRIGQREAAQPREAQT